MASYTKHDLEFILKQIKIAEADVAGGTAINVADLVGSPLLPYGLRTLTGTQNNLVPGQSSYGSADGIFPRLLDPVFNPAEVSPAAFGPPRQTSYAQTSGSVFDSQPRTISNLIADQTISNPAAIAAALQRAGSVNPTADAQIIVNALYVSKAAAAAAVAAQLVANTANTNLAAAQTGNSALLNALVAAQGANSTAQTNKAASEVALTTAQSNTAAALLELSAAQSAASTAASALTLANNNVTSANQLVSTTAAQAASDAALAAGALTASNNAANAAIAADAAEAAALVAYNNAVASATAGSPEIAAALANYNAAIAAADVANTAASDALGAYGVASAAAAASAQVSADAVIAQNVAQTAQTSALSANGLAQAALVVEQGLLTNALDAANTASSNLLTANNNLAAANQLVITTADQAAADLANFGAGSAEAIASAQLATDAVAAQGLAQTARDNAFGLQTIAQDALTAAQASFASADAAATATAATLSVANSNLATATQTASNAAFQAASDAAASNLALTASTNAAANATLADNAKAAALVSYNDAIATYAVSSPAAVAALAAYNLAIAASDTATADASAALSASGAAATTAAASAQAASDAVALLANATITQSNAVSANTSAQANLVTEQNEYQAAVDAEAAALTTFNGLSSIADGTAAALTAAQNAASAGDGDLAAAILAANNANAALTAATNLANTTDANADQVTADLGLEISPNGTIFIPNQATDEGLSAQYNSWFTLFGQFFDHGLDSVAKGGSGTVFIPLKPDDPLYVEGSNTNFMVLTRATNQPGADGVLGTADDVREHTNTTSPFIDQNQTYSSHPSHQVFLRAYEVVGGIPKDTGELIENRDLGVDGKYGTADDILLGGMATWEVVKAQARDILGINLSDADVNGGPLLATDDYGNFIPGANGLPQLVTGAGLVQGNIGAPVSTAAAIRGGYAFLDDIAHNAAPRNSNGTMKTPDADDVAGGPVAAGQYDNEMLDAHYIAGDGRVNENIGLTAVHSIFHSEHNRLVQHTKDVVLASNDLAFINEWLATDLTTLPTSDQIAGLNWDGQRLFQAAKFGTEMQYQHLVFEEFGRKIQVQIDVFAGYNSTINPAIVAEFAHVVYRFGHSMLNETVDRFDASFGLVNGTEQVGLIEAFLNPLEFAASGVDSATAAGAIVRGMTRQVGNELDEFVTEAVRNNLVGLPLDLAALNIARGRDTGVPTLNAARREFYAGTSDAQLKPYESWVDFATNTKHAESAINFIAAYGTHAQLLMSDVNTMAEKRDVAIALIMGGSATINAGTAQERVFTAVEDDRLAFLNSTGIYANLASGVTTTGVDAIDFWMGGLAERQMPFGGLLGSTFNFVFETQMEQLQDGDRMYYLARTAGLNFLTELEGNSFASMIMRNTDATHLPGDVFSVPNFILEVDQSKQHTGLGVDGRADPTGGSIFTPLVVRNNPSTTGPDSNYLRFTGGEHVVLGGTAGNDILIASAGDDTIWGDAGDDRIEGGDGVDLLNGGDGNDIITDLGGDDNIKGGEGDDVISGGNGFDLILAGGGSDFVVAGEDPKEVFGNQGNDFILGGSTFDTFFGNQGDDWLDGSGSADLLQGDMGDPFQASTIFGNDVIIGGGGNDDYDSESGDDIMVMGAGTQRAEGMLGFDWVTHKNQGVGADADLAFTGLLPPDVDNLKDRFDNVEGISGWNLNDTLRGDNFGSAQLLTEAVAGDVRTNHALNNVQQIALINGLQGLLDGMLGAGQTGFSGGNIMMGGGGSDTLEGRGGNDLIDGDAWLNVRIKVTGHPTITSVESMAEIAPLLFSGVIKPSQLSIVREILSTSVAADIDTAVYSGNQADYDVVNNGNGTFTVTHARNIGGVDEGTDTIRNIERLQFADGILDFSNVAPIITSNGGTATATINVAENSVAVSTVTATDANVGNVLTYSLSAAVAANNADAALFTINPTTGALSFVGARNFEGATDAGADGVYNVVVQVRDAGGLTDTQAIAVTVTNVNEAPVITGGDVAATAINENTTAVTTVVATDVDAGAVPSYTLAGGADVGLFTINASTGALSFINAPDFENASDVGADNIYNVIVQASDAGGLIDTQAIAVTVNDVVELADVAPTGALNISSYTRNAASTNASITATNTLSDANGMTGFVPFQWQQLIAGVWTNIAGATAATLASRSNATVRVTSSYTDSFGLNSFVSAQTAIIGTTATSTIAGLAGNDIMLGLAGNDILTASAGNDTVDGGIGNDTYSLAATAADAIVNLTTNTSSSALTGVDTLVGIETVIGGAGNDSMTDGAGASRLEGGNGNDVFIVTNDNARDILRGGNGVDTIDYSALSANLTVNLGGTNDVLGSGTAGNLDNINGFQNVFSGAGNDSILGDNLVNTIDGGGGNDSINGSGGADRLTGGTGADTFVHTATGNSGVGAGRDVIADFISGLDKLDFSAIDANTATVLPANEAFTFIGTGAFTAAAQVRYQLIDTDANGSLDSTLVRGNVNAGLGADFEVLLQGVVTPILATDIVL